MTKFLSFAMIAMLGASVVGCKASGEVGDADSSDSSTYKKTTTVHDNGDTKTTKTEVKKEY
jgi:hypothetical protein